MSHGNPPNSSSIHTWKCVYPWTISISLLYTWGMLLNVLAQLFVDSPSLDYPFIHTNFYSPYGNPYVDWSNLLFVFFAQFLVALENSQTSHSSVNPTEWILWITLQRMPAWLTNIQLWGGLLPRACTERQTWQNPLRSLWLSSFDCQ